MPPTRSTAEDDDWGQAGTLVREVMDDAQRDRLVSNVVGHLSQGVSPPVLERAVEYWRNIDKELGDRIAGGVGRLVESPTGDLQESSGSVAGGMIQWRWCSASK